MRARFNDPDMWWHLKTAKSSGIRTPSPRWIRFGTAAGHAWIAQEWLSQLAIYAAYHFGGDTGLMLWLCLFASLIFIAAYALCTFYSSNAKVAFLGALMILAFLDRGLIRSPAINWLSSFCIGTADRPLRAYSRPALVLCASVRFCALDQCP